MSTNYLPPKRPLTWTDLIIVACTVAVIVGALITIVGV